MSLKAEFVDILARQKNVFLSGKTLDIDFRRSQIQKVADIMVNHRQDLIDALCSDFKKPVLQIKTEINCIYSKAYQAINNLQKWAAGVSIPNDMVTFNAHLSNVPQPYGSVLIIAPWNFPIITSLEPLIGAIAAGNTIVLKLSEQVPALSAKMKQLIETNLDNECFSVITEPYSGEQLTQLDFDYVFYTGSTEIGRKIYQTVSKKLIPVTLELGGSCPCYVHFDADIDTAAKRIAHIKAYNAGQMCFTVNHVFVHKKVAQDFKDAIINAWKSFFNIVIPFFRQDMKQSPDLGRIISEPHTERLQAIIEKYKHQIVFGGDTDVSDRYVQPTLISCNDPNSEIIKHEIFGPILPVCTVEDEHEAINIIEMHQKPLKIFLFSNSATVIDRFLVKTRSGGLTINEGFLCAAPPDLPFGGVGESGMGRYHGIETFNTFSNYRAIYKEKYRVGLLDNLIYPPFTPREEALIDTFESKQYSRSCNIL
ncbi:Aldehyde dehydrogenase family 3 member B1 [Thelohanellus kitauei]|uniref:Aldehyde dehydrogenase n=1 Tax=Thelohanellus kitauei TaxID=669202 RepID=A0A0C2MDR3_THEKT|nr:Aldehyde dehydrogenase family 3 member B1 [Thelohanellus kitauei]